MYERSYGYRYDEVKDLTTVDIARRIRADIKQAKAEGLLPTRWTYSVRTDHGTSIDVDVRDCPDAWQPCDGTVPGSRRTYPDGSSTATGCPDVWCAARNDPERAHAAKPHDVLTEEARLEERKANREAGEPCGYYVNYSRDGRQTVHVAVKTPEGKTVLACGARVWHGGLGGLSTREHEVTCSRCAKKTQR